MFAKLLPASVLLALSLAACATPPSGGETLGDALRAASDPRAGMAPDDTGDALKHHDYVVKTSGGESVFVWIPSFTAYQVLHKTGELPRGAWVKDRPAGVEGFDWARDTFGGFYIGKYEASMASDGSAIVRKGLVPWSNVEWEDAKRVSEAIAPGKSHMVRGDEWTALAIWTAINGIDVRGNTKYGKDGLDTATTFEKATEDGVALTGSARNAAWTGGSDTTSHTGGPDGVFDLVGNLREWESSTTLRGWEFYIDGVATGIGGTAPGYITSLHTQPELRRFGIVAGTSEKVVVNYFNADAYHVSGFAAPGGGHAGNGGPSGGDESREYRTNRGGTYIDGHSGEVAQAGLWLLCSNREVGYRSTDQGFRPALKF
jgi:hypothetical protein